MTAWVCGEALIDLLPGGPVVGGGPANTAKALARLGRSVEFIGGISADKYGTLITDELHHDGVGISLSLRSENPTATAEVKLDKKGVASYIFELDNSATFEFGASWLPDPSRLKPQILQIGSLATIVEPGSQALCEWALRVSEFAPVIYDPNIRTAFLSDHGKYLESVEKWISIASVVKASDDDISWLYPGTDIVDVAKNWIGRGVEFVVITRGDRGLVAVSANEIVEVPSVPVVVVDTVGAGDTVGAVIVDAILEHGSFNLRGELMRQALNRAAVAAAIVCSRVGAQPPTRDEINQEKNRT